MADALSFPPAATRVEREERRHRLLYLLDRRPSPLLLRRIHALVLRLDLLSYPNFSRRLLTASACSSTHFSYALKVFDQIPHPNLYCWNVLLRACSSSPGDEGPALALRLLSRLLRETHFSPDKFTYPFAIKAASALRDGRLGRALHGLVAKSPFHTDVFTCNLLIDFYASSGEVDLAFELFARMPKRDVVSWNTIIHGYVDAGRCEESVEVFRDMEREGVWPSEVTMVGLLAACGMTRDLELGKWVHSYVENESNGIEKNLILLNSLLDMYAKCGKMEHAREVFDVMPERDAISWTTLLTGYAKSRDFVAAKRVFDEAPAQRIQSWNALISAYEQGGRPREALDAFHECLRVKNIKANEVTFVSALSACAQLGCLDMGSWIHSYVKENEVKPNDHLVTSLIDMYAKCGDLAKALKVFVAVEVKDVFMWSAMIAAFAMHGQGSDALDLFEKMVRDDTVNPNAVTFIHLLCACSRAGLVGEGKQYFHQMVQVYGIEPKLEHYASMVDILGRAGCLEEAAELIAGMPMPPDAAVWGALLGACSIRGNIKLGELAFNRLLKLQPADAGAYVPLSKLYAKSGRQDRVVTLRKMVMDAGLKKEPQCSSIEVEGVLHEFLVGDSSHPMSEAIYSQLEEIMPRLKMVGYHPDWKQMSPYVKGGAGGKEEEVKEHTLPLHSEKLAIAFGLISWDSPAPIRIVKNFRICEDCHTFAKLVSSIYGREIMIREGYRFHHFKEGQCSCMDHW